MHPVRSAALAALALASLAAPAPAQTRVRVATYNIENLGANVSPERADRIRTVIDRLGAQVIGLQEMVSRPALERVFSADQWHLVIDDDSTAQRNLAVAIRKPLRPVGLARPDTLNAEEADFLFPDPLDDDFFPERRDVLSVQVEAEGGARFRVLVVHMKSRKEGRFTTNPRRVGAAQKLVRELERRYDEEDFVILGDWNDNPDDQSLNILETGDVTAQTEKEESDGPFLVNLCEPLVLRGHVSYGRGVGDVVNGTVDTVDAGSRDRNFNNRFTNVHTGDILFDQLLVPVRTKARYVAESVRVFDDEIAVRGPAGVRASDHLPVYADFDFVNAGGGGGPPPPPPPEGPALRIAALLPDPDGPDPGNEWVELRNTTAAAIPVDGWKLRDRAGNEFRLDGAADPGATRRFALPARVMTLNNDGDAVELIDRDGAVRHQVRYTAVQARRGRVVTFE
jgi:endonuclease/exonuclease/phosphatase family metal-dependent hydrolase